MPPGAGDEEARPNGRARSPADRAGAGEPAPQPAAGTTASEPASEEDEPRTGAGEPLPEEPQPADAPGACGTELDLEALAAPGSELIVDVHTIAVPVPLNSSTPVLGLLAGLDQPWIERTPDCTDIGCLAPEEYVAQVFEASATRYGVLGGIAYSVGPDGSGTGSSYAALTTEDLLEIADDVDAQLGATGVLKAPAVMPNDRLELQLSRMERLADRADAWTLRPAWRLEGRGYFLNDEAGRRTIEQGLALGRSIFLVHKGMPESGDDLEYGDPKDIGAAAASYPSARFVVLHAGFEYGLAVGESSAPDPDDAGADLGWGAGVGEWPEGPYDEDDPDVQERYPLDRGVNRLIASLREHGVGPGGNVYAALNGVWAELMTRPVEAAHVLGKLLRFLGEDNVLWATDSVWYGGPRPQIEAFREFQIPEDLRAAHGYPELTAERKAKILGLNAARLFCLQP